MGWLKLLGGWLFGSSNGAGKVAEVIDEAVYTKQEQAVDDTKDLASARSYEPGGKFDSFVDKWHRAIRPAIATWAILILFGVLPPPDHWQAIPQPVWEMVLLVITFYFGGRTLVKDLPAAIAAMRKR